MQSSLSVVMRHPQASTTRHVTSAVALRHLTAPPSRPPSFHSAAQPQCIRNYRHVRAISNRDEAPWEVLGVDPDSSEREIKAAHRKLVLEHHPDRVLSTAELGSADKKVTVQKRFMRIQEAYEMLMGRRHVHMGTSDDQDGWNFHDFFWSFNYHRRKKEGERKRPPPPAGSWKGQIENLKRRAAARKWKKARQARGTQAGWVGNIMNVGGSEERGGGSGDSGDSGSSSASSERPSAGGPVKSKAVSSQLEGLKRKAHLKKTILNDGGAVDE